MKAKVELSAESLKAVIDRHKPKSLTGLAHGLGYKGSVSSTLTRKFRALIPDIDAMLKGATGAAKGADGKAAVAKGNAVGKRKAKVASSPAKPAAKSNRKWPHAEKSPFRPGSSYDTCYSILAAHKEGLTREKLVELLATATGKDAKHAAFDAQVLLSARGNDDEPGLSRNDGPRHRSCRPGFWVKRNNSHVQLVVD